MQIGEISEEIHLKYFHKIQNGGKSNMAKNYVIDLNSALTKESNGTSFLKIRLTGQKLYALTRFQL